MPWGTDKRMMELFDLADRKGFDVVKSTMKDHVRLIGPDDKSVKNDKGGAAFSYSEARRYLEALPDRKVSAASYVPARRAARVDPMESLRGD